MTRGDSPTRALEELATAAEAAAADQLELAREAKALAGLEDSSRPWHRTFTEERSDAVLKLLARSTTRLGSAAGRFRRDFVSGLAAEGATTRDIASRLGVTHQRVSTLLRHRP